VCFVRPVVRYGRGYFPIVAPTDDHLPVLGDALAAWGRALAMSNSARI
jgi:hypothetical protein